MFNKHNRANSLQALDLYCTDNEGTIAALYADYGEEAPVNPDTLLAMVTLYKEPFCIDLFDCTLDSETIPVKDQDGFIQYLDECVLNLQGAPAMNPSLQPRILGIKRHHLAIGIIIAVILIVIWHSKKKD